MHENDPKRQPSFLKKRRAETWNWKEDDAGFKNNLEIRKKKKTDFNRNDTKIAKREKAVHGIRGKHGKKCAMDIEPRTFFANGDLKTIWNSGSQKKLKSRNGRYS